MGGCFDLFRAKVEEDPEKRPEKAVAAEAGLALDRYFNYRSLKAHEKEGVDYAVSFRRRASAVAVMAPHGGGIEPGTCTLARMVAGADHTFYAFRGLKPRGNRRLHLESARFDEPVALQLAGESSKVVTVHGCADTGEVVYVGGLDEELKEKVFRALEKAGFRVREHEHFRGRNPVNLCNRGRCGRGVQLELGAGLRRVLFRGPLRRDELSPLGRDFVAAVRSALAGESDAEPCSEISSAKGVSRRRARE